MYHVSIIVPIFNVAECVTDSILSALNQTYENIEFIFVDDCSTDSSMDVVQKIVDSHWRKNDVFIYKMDKNSGVSMTRNSGISKATGEFIFFMDSDDKLSSNCIQLHYEAAIKYNADFTVSGHKIIGSRTVHKASSEFLQKKNVGIVQSYLKKEWSFTSCNKLIKRTIVIDNELFFPPDIIRAEDILWTFRLALCAKNMVSLPETTYFYIIRDNSAISSSYGESNISSFTYVLEQISLMISKSKIYDKIFKEANSFITFHRFNVALFIINNSDTISKKKIMYNRLNTREFYVFTDYGVMSKLLRLPFPIFNYLLYLPYNLYKRVQ
ncbi:Glycosyltransferase involved in cell wall bisynthesis [Flavobacterium fluvii]|uniref:Glycosyltransferase involved in cell wall bisynthesis n=2 Tax=Flavobacterium fluvii TaxID=468056 RepID=A0A1M5IKX1_9FLAO|nr:Glycosyltransferase involved in cell wall bisynthesis [Flavobacterium fluvii]